MTQPFPFRIEKLSNFLSPYRAKPTHVSETRPPSHRHPGPSTSEKARISRPRVTATAFQLKPSVPGGGDWGAEGVRGKRRRRHRRRGRPLPTSPVRMDPPESPPAPAGRPPAPSAAVSLYEVGSTPHPRRPLPRFAASVSSANAKVPPFSLFSDDGGVLRWDLGWE